MVTFTISVTPRLDVSDTAMHNRVTGAIKHSILRLISVRWVESFTINRSGNTWTVSTITVIGVTATVAHKRIENALGHILGHLKDLRWFISFAFTSTEDTTMTGQWTPTIANIIHNQDSTLTAGTITVLNASWVGDANLAFFKVWGNYQPPTANSADENKIEVFDFDLSLPFNVTDFTAHAEIIAHDIVADNPLTPNTDESEYYGGQGGGGLVSVVGTDVSPYNRCRVNVGIHTWAQTAFRKWFVVDGVLIRT